MVEAVEQRLVLRQCVHRPARRWPGGKLARDVGCNPDPVDTGKAFTGHELERPIFFYDCSMDCVAEPGTNRASAGLFRVSSLVSTRGRDRHGCWPTRISVQLARARCPERHHVDSVRVPLLRLRFIDWGKKLSSTGCVLLYG